METTVQLLKSSPVIAAVRDMEYLDQALESRVKVIFMMGGRLSRVKEITHRVQQSGRHIFLHVELLQGLGRDKEAIKYIANEVRPQGVVCTKPHLLQAAKKYDIATVLQIFMIDSQAYETGVKNITALKPDAVEIMPGLMPRVIRQIRAIEKVPLITAGLIKSPDEVEAMIAAGCSGITVSEQRLWNYVPRSKAGGRQPASNKKG